MRNLNEFEQVSGDTTWGEVTPPVAGERVRVETIDGNWLEGHVVAWDRVQLVVRQTIRPSNGKRAFPRWSVIFRVVFLDRPRG